MSIVYDKENQVFHLQAGDTSYVMGVVRGYLTHLYWGKRLNRYGASLRNIRRQGTETTETVLMEC